MSDQRTHSTAVGTTEADVGTSTQEHDPPVETNHMSTKVRQKSPSVPKKSLTDEEKAKKRRIQYVFEMLNSAKKSELPYMSTVIPDKCQNCSKEFDDIVRQVHTDLMSGRIVMLGIWRRDDDESSDDTIPETHDKKMQTSQCMAHCEGCQCHLPVDQRTPFQRDFSGGTMSGNECHCTECMEGNASVWVKIGKSSRTDGKAPRWHKSRAVPYRARRAHTPCEDDALKDLHNHVLAGDQNLPGETFVKVLGSLHGQGPCRKDCKLKADVAWMKKNVPKQVATQTCMTREMSVQTKKPRARRQATQANLQRSVGIQKGACLARIRHAKASWHRNSAIQVCLPELPHTHRPVGKVIGVQSHI